MTIDSAVMAGVTQVRQGVAEKFSFVRNLGRVQVPRSWGRNVNYDDLRILCSPVASKWDDRINGSTFRRARHEFCSERRYTVELYEPVNPGSATTYQDSMDFLGSQGGLFVGVPGLVLLMTERQEGFKNTFSEGESITMPDLPDKLWTDYRTNAKFVPSFTMMSGRFVVELQDSADTWAPQQYLPLIREFVRKQLQAKK